MYRRAFYRANAGGGYEIEIRVGKRTHALDALLGDAPRRRELAAAGAVAVMPFDWFVIAAQVMRVYEVAIAGTRSGERLR